METHTLAAALRTAVGSGIDQLRTGGQIPAVIYGNKKDNTNIAVDAVLFGRVLRKVGETGLIQLTVDGESEARNVLAHDLQKDPVTDDVIHVDFLEVDLKVEIEATVPLTFVGESEAVKALGGTLITNKTEVEVKCLPTDIPHEIEVDISSLATFDDNITAADLKIPANVALLTDPEEVIALVNEPRSEEELAALDEAVTEDMESIGDSVEKKDEEESEEGSGEE